MQPKLLLLGLATAATATALPAVDVEARDTDNVDANIETRATHTWEAAGGCKTDWGGKCLNTCKKEAKQKGYNCKAINSNIWKSDCWLGWSVCDCGCKT